MRHSDSHRRALSILERYGEDPLAWQTLESAFHQWFPTEEGSPDAFVGYVDTGTAWVTAGPPVAPAEKQLDVARGFTTAAKRHGRRVVFFGAQPEFLRALGAKALCIGTRPGWDPRRWTLEGNERASLRYQIRRAARKGVTVRTVTPEEIYPGSVLRGRLDDLAADWQDRHAMPPMGFVVLLEPYVFPEWHRYLVAECGGRVVGFLSAVPVFGRQGWFVEDLLRSDDAPNGTAESLIDHFFRGAQEDAFVTLGLVPLAGDIPWPLRAVRTLSHPFFNFPGLLHFKEKLRPDQTEARYLGGAEGMSQARALFEVLRAFSGVGILRFFLATLGRGPKALLGLLTLLLIAWIPFLVTAKGAWFASPGIRRGWVVFDLVLVAGLLTVYRRYRHGLAWGLALAVTMDTVLTVYSAVTFNLSRAHGVRDYLIILGACLGPAAGAATLWSVVRRQARRRFRGALNG